MSMSVVLYADPMKEPEPYLLGGTATDKVLEIQNIVGGAFDCIKRGCSDESGKHDNFMLLGYVHDEGRIRDLPINAIASVLFDQHVFGDVLICNGGNPEVPNDGSEDYDLPVAFSEYLIHGMFPAIQQSVLFSKMLAQSVSRAVKDGILSQDDMNRISDFMERELGRDGASPCGHMEDMPEDIQELLKKAMKYSFFGEDAD
jgi:hypothetical protein